MMTSPTGGVEAGTHGRGLAEVAAEADQAEVRNPLRVGHQLLPRAVRAAVIDQHNLIGAAQLGKRGVQLVAQEVDALLLVEDGDYDGNRRRWTFVLHR
jgi:hypothetical protein